MGGVIPLQQYDRPRIYVCVQELGPPGTIDPLNRPSHYSGALLMDAWGFMAPYSVLLPTDPNTLSPTHP